jgi:hypothetical protein
VVVVVTVKEALYAVWPLTVTEIGPVVAPVGTGTTIDVAFQVVGLATVPLNVTALPPCVAPKFVPEIVTEAPTAPDAGETFVIVGADSTTKLAPLLLTPDTVTTTFPVVAPLGTGTTIEFALQVDGLAAVPLKVTVLVPCVDPKFVPEIVTEVPTAPDAGERLVMVGVSNTVNDTPALDTPPTVTTTLPVLAPLGTGVTMLVALQLLGVAGVPLKVTVLVPWVDPKFNPAIVTEMPTGPDVGERLLMLGEMVNVTPLLGAPLTVTTTGPVVAPLGTGATMLDALQLLGVAGVPLKVTVFVP